MESHSSTSSISSGKNSTSGIPAMQQVLTRNNKCTSWTEDQGKGQGQWSSRDQGEEQQDFIHSKKTCSGWSKTLFCWSSSEETSYQIGFEEETDHWGEQETGCSSFWWHGSFTFAPGGLFTKRFHVTIPNLSLSWRSLELPKSSRRKESKVQIRF